MKKLILIAFIGFCLFGCSNKNEIRDTTLEESLIEINNYAYQHRALILNKIIKEMTDSPTRNKPHYNKAFAIDKKIILFIKKLNKIYLDSTGTLEIEPLIKEYNILLDTLQNQFLKPYYKGQYKNDTIDRKDYFKRKNKLSDKVIALEMIGNVLFNEIRVESQILIEKMSSFSWTFDVESISSEEKKSENNNIYSIGLTSDFYHFERLRNINIDTIMLNDKIIKKPHTFKINKYIATIDFDSLNNGSYIIKGTIEEYDPSGEYYYKPFSHKFEIKK